MRQLAGLFLLLLPAACGGTDAEPIRGQPNVLMIVMDTTRADRCSAYGYDRPTTPSLEAFARDAVVFEDAWSPSPWTGPAHASLFTGLLPPRHGYMHSVRDHLRPDAETLAEHLLDAGYRTACLTNNGFITPAFGMTQGFETVETLADHPDAGYPTAAWAHFRAMDTITASKVSGRPFFVFINHTEPHAPYDPPQPAREEFVTERATEEELRHARAYVGPELTRRVMAGSITKKEWRLLSDLYDAEVAALDAEIGSFLDQLAEEGHLENTLVVILSDHGENLGERGLGGHDFDLHRTVLRVPLILRYPGRFEGGRRQKGVVRLQDLMPTILEICGLEVPEELDGLPLRRGLEGRLALGFFGPVDPTGFERDCPGFESSGLGGGIRSVYDGRRHLILHEDGREELYDLTNDPAESTSLVEQGGPDLDRLRAALAPH